MMANPTMDTVSGRYICQGTVLKSRMSDHGPTGSTLRVYDHQNETDQ